MARIDKEHQDFIQLMENPDFTKFVKEFAPGFRLEFKNGSSKNSDFNNKKVISFVDWLFRLSEDDYYLLPTPQANSTFMLISKDFGSSVLIQYCTSLTKATERLLKEYREVIEIVQLHSKIKGSGSKILNELIRFSKDIQLPLVLYTETESLVNYYEQFDFINYGQHGDDNEYLLIRIPESNSRFKFKL